MKFNKNENDVYGQNYWLSWVQIITRITNVQPLIVQCIPATVYTLYLQKTNLYKGFLRYEISKTRDAWCIPHQFI